MHQYQDQLRLKRTHFSAKFEGELSKLVQGGFKVRHADLRALSTHNAGRVYPNSRQAGRYSRSVKWSYPFETKCHANTNLVNYAVHLTWPSAPSSTVFEC